MNFRKKRPLLRSLLHMAGKGAFFCILSCTLIGCGSSKETISENEKKPYKASNIAPKPQNEPDRKQAGQVGLKAVDNIFQDGANEMNIPPVWMGKPAEAGAQGMDYSGPVETIPAFPVMPDLSPQELDAVRRSAAMSDTEIDAIEVIPPDKPGGSGITHGELKARVVSLSAGLTDLDSLEVVPPREPGGRGMTLGEMKALNSLAGPDSAPPDFEPTKPPEDHVGTGK